VHARLALVVALLTSACATTAVPKPAPPAPVRPTLARELVAQDPRAVRVFDGHSGASFSWEQLVERAGASDLVLIGENHGHPLGLACAAALFEDLMALHSCAGLSMEFFERDEQSRIDDWLSGLSDESTFEKRTQRSSTGSTGGNWPAGHRAMLHTAKRAGRAVIAANAPRALVRLVREKGYGALDALTEEQQRLVFVPPWLVEGRYREEFNKFMAGDWGPYEAEQAARLESVFRSQSLWDWTMADSIRKGLERGIAPLVHVVGRFHVDHQGGTVQAVRILRPDARIFVVSFVDEQAEALEEDDRERGDAVIYVGK
jgi:uncharacterized iron-regulated protein